MRPGRIDVRGSSERERKGKGGRAALIDEQVKAKRAEAQQRVAAGRAAAEEKRRQARARVEAAAARIRDGEPKP